MALYLLKALPFYPEVQAPILFSLGTLCNIGALIYVHNSEYLSTYLIFDSISFIKVIYFAQLIAYISMLYFARRLSAGGKFIYKRGQSGELLVKDKKGRTVPIILKDKTVVITGGNAGIGYVTALNFAKWGSRVVIACRDEKKGNQAANSLRKQSGSDKIEFFQLDLASFDSIRNFAKNWNENPNGRDIDILINNAGVMMCPFSLTKEGYELQFGTNHLGHFLLTKLLLSNVIATEGRIVNLSSLAHLTAPDIRKVDWTQFTESYKSKYDSATSYGYSKISNILFTRQLLKEISHTGVTVYCLHPGAVRTELLRHLNFFVQYIVKPLQMIFFKSAEEGCQTTLYCALHPDAIPGEYYADCKIGAQHPFTKDPREWERLWLASEAIVNEN